VTTPPPDSAPLDVAGLARLYERATLGEWHIQDGCSWRRIGTHFHDGDVLCPTNSRTDGHPDLCAADGRLYDNLKFIVAAHENWPALLSRITELEAHERAFDERRRRLETALRVSRGWVITCSSSAQARRDLKTIDAALGLTPEGTPS